MVKKIFYFLVIATTVLPSIILAENHTSHTDVRYSGRLSISTRFAFFEEAEHGGPLHRSFQQRRFRIDVLFKNIESNQVRQRRHSCINKKASGNCSAKIIWPRGLTPHRWFPFNAKFKGQALSEEEVSRGCLLEEVPFRITRSKRKLNRVAWILTAAPVVVCPDDTRPPVASPTVAIGATSPSPVPTILADATKTSEPTVTALHTATSSATATSTSSMNPTTTLTNTPTSSATSTSTQTASPTFSNTNVPSPTPSLSPTAVTQPSVTATSSSTASASATITATITHSHTATSSPTVSATFSYTSTATYTPSTSPSSTASTTPTATITHSHTATSSPTMSATFSHTSTATYTPSISPSATSSASHTPTSTATYSPTDSPEATSTPTLTPSPTRTATATHSSTASATMTVTVTQTYSPTPSLSPTAVATRTSTVLPTTTSSPTRTPSRTPTKVPTFTPTVTRSPTSTSSATPTSSKTPSPTPTSSPTSTKPDLFQASISAQSRLETFNSPWSNLAGGWEYYYSGDGTPVDTSIPYTFWSDSPVDDDYHEDPNGSGSCRFTFDDPNPFREAPPPSPPLKGFMTINRILSPRLTPCPPGDDLKRGPMMRRDEFLSFDQGIVMEARLKIPDMGIQGAKNLKQDDAVFLQYVNDVNSFAIYLSPRCLKVGPISPPYQNPGRHKCENGSDTPGISARALVSSATPVTVRAIQNPAVPNKVDVYVNGEYFLSGQPGLDTVSNNEYEYPYFLIGDNVGEPPANHVPGSAALALDYFAYKRLTPNPDRKRVPAELPRYSALAKNFRNGFEFNQPLPILYQSGQPRRHFAGDGINAYQIGYMNSAGVFSKENSPGAISVLHINSTSSGSYTYEKMEEILNDGAWTVELSAKVRPGNDARSFALRWDDGAGSVALVLSNDRVELALGSKPIGYSLPILLNTTDRFHTYRLTRIAGSPYVSLFVDGKLAIKYFKLSAFQINGSAKTSTVSRISFGWLGHEFYTEFPNGSPVSRRTQKLDLDYLKWTPSTYIP